MRASLRQMLPQILFWLFTIFVTHYLTKVSCQRPDIRRYNFERLPVQSFLSELRVVQTKAILFSKSMSERGGSDIKRL